jgi:hypothetical protein
VIPTLERINLALSNRVQVREDNEAIVSPCISQAATIGYFGYEIDNNQ